MLHLLRRSIQFLLDCSPQKNPKKQNTSDKTMGVRREEMGFIFLSAWLIRQDAVGWTRCGAVLVELVPSVILLANLCEVVHTQAAQLLCDGTLTL